MSHFRIHLSVEYQGHVEDVWPEFLTLIQLKTFLFADRNSVGKIVLYRLILLYFDYLNPIVWKTSTAVRLLLLIREKYALCT